MAGVWKAAVLAAALGAAAIAAGATARAGGDRPEVEPGGRAYNRFLFFAALEGACEDALPEEALGAVLEKDAKGRYRNFVYGCPVCHPILDGLRAYSMRREIYFSAKGDPLSAAGFPGEPSPVADLAVRVSGKDPAARGGALKSLVERWVNARMDRLRLTEGERGAWRRALETAREKGMGLLPSSEGFEHKSCPSCDGATGNDDPWK